jgi:hypothetical protein
MGTASGACIMKDNGDDNGGNDDSSSDNKANEETRPR